MLRWGHLAPTAPDTLATYPFSDQDPFILDAAPHVLFAGNQPEFATRVATGGQACRLPAQCASSLLAAPQQPVKRLLTAMHEQPPRWGLQPWLVKP